MNHKPKAEDPGAWAQRVVTARAMLFHTATMVVGVAEEHLPPGAFKDPAGNSIPKDVVRLSTGHALLADPESFVELTEAEASYFVEATQRMTGFVAGALQFAGQHRIPPKTATVLLGAILRSHIISLERL